MFLSILAGVSVSATTLIIAVPIAYLLEKSTEYKEPKGKYKNRYK